MEKNIFENAYFGKPYKTKGEKKAIYIHHYKDSEGGDMHYLIIDGSVTTYVWGADGKIAPSYNNDELDIVSEWEEEIDDIELYKLALMKNPNMAHSEDLYEVGMFYGFNNGFNLGFKAGHRKQ